MAIAYYVPREYGPPEQNAQNNPEIIDLHNHHFAHQDANNNNVQRPVQQPRPSADNHSNLVSLFSGFVTEMMAVFRNGGVEQVAQRNEQNQQEPGRMRMRRPAAQNLPDLQIQGNGQDNQPNLPDLIPTPLRSLPDIVTCHAGISFHYNSTNNQDDSSRQGPTVAPLSPTSSNHQPTTTMDFEVSVKWGVGIQQETPPSVPPTEETEQLTPEETFRLAGAHLRMIADSFQNERSHGRTRRTTQSTFELKIVISVAIPTVALVGLGLAYLRRS